MPLLILIPYVLMEPSLRLKYYLLKFKDLKTMLNLSLPIIEMCCYSTVYVQSLPQFIILFLHLQLDLSLCPNRAPETQ